MSNLVIVAIPAEDDPVWRISSEKVPHLTLLFLGEDPDTVAKTGEIAAFLEHAAKTSLTKFSLDVDHRGTLGKDEADVVFFAGWDLPELIQFRGYLLKDSNIAKAYLSADQFPHWQPHLTLGYPEAPAAKPIDIYDRVTWVRFDKVALWTDDFDGPTFELKSPNFYDQDMAVSMSTTVEDILSHHGVKGMKWGRRKSSGPVAVTTVANKKGVVKTVGGKNHPTHVDALPAKIAIQKAKKSGISSLSDQELQTITKRLNLEQQVSSLGKSDLMSTGERFVTMLLDESNRGGKKR